MLRKALVCAALAFTAGSSFAVQSWDTVTGFSASFSGDESSQFNFSLSADAFTFAFAGSASDLSAVYLDGMLLPKVLETPDTWYLEVPNLAAGAHSMTVFTANSFTPYVDTFLGSVTVTGATITPGAVSAVPEPEVAMMLMAGIGAVGFMSRRRKIG